MGIIYCLTSPSGKQYIGQTIRSIEKRLYEHETRSECEIIHNSIKKYGIDNFIVDILFESDDINELDDMEVMFIEKMNTLFPNGYNIRTGGCNGKHCQASKEKMRISKMGLNNPNFGKPRNDDVKRKISLAKKRENHHFYGKKLTLNHKLKLSQSHKKYDLPMYLIKVKERPAPHYNGSGYAIINHPHLKTKYFTSKKLSDEDKLKMAIEYLNSVE